MDTEVVEEPGTETPVEIEATPGQVAAIDVERQWFGAVIKGFLVALPIGAAFFVGLVALALVGQGFEVTGALIVAVIVGVNAGAFFGPWAAVVRHAHRLDEADQRAAHHG